MTPYHPLTRTGTPPDDAAMIWPWPHNWSAQVVRRPEWSTVVLASATGAEQRQALREYPREQVTYEHLLEGDDAALAFTLLRVWKGRDWLVPDWTEATKTTAPAGAVLSLARSSAGAGMALLGTEVVTLLDADGTLEVAPSGSWPAGTVLVPLRLATLDADQTVSSVTGSVSRISPVFLFEDVRVVDESVLTRISHPGGAVTTSEGVLPVEGKYGRGLSATSMALYREGYLRTDVEHTLEFWVKIPAPGEIRENILRASVTTNRIDYNPFEGNIDFYWIFPYSFSVPGYGEWFHLAVVRDADWTLRWYLNGKLQHTHLDPFHFTGTEADLGLLSLFTAVLPERATFSGILDDVRMTHTCRYIADFVPGPCAVGEGDPFWPYTAFLLTGDQSRWGQGPTGPLAAASNPRARMLPVAHNWASSAQASVAREVDVLDPGVGLRHRRPARDTSTMSWTYTTLLDSDLDIWAFRAFLQQHRGSAIGFYAAPPGSELTVTAVGGGKAFGPHFRLWPENSRPFPILAILTASGWGYEAVDRVLVDGRLQMMGMPVYPPGTILAARGVHHARVMGDAVEIRYTTPGVAEVSLPLVSVAQ
jgi:hypothetical protein